MFQLGVITDEVSQDFEIALQFAERHGLDCVELRSAWEKGPFEFTEDDILKIKLLKEQYHMPIAAVSSPFYKCSYFDEQTKAAHLAGFARTVRHAKLLGVSYIRCFDFLRDDRVTKEMVKEAFQEPIDLCEREGLIILIESEPTTNSCDCEKTAAIVNYINSPAVKSLYEPGNDIYSPTAEIPYPDGFRFVENSFCHVHVKDAVKTGGKAVGVAVGDGLVDYSAIIKELLQSNFSGAVVLETHYRKSGAISDSALKNPRGSQISSGGEAASEECIVNLKNIISQAKREVL